MICPNCATFLQTIEYEGVNVQACDGCGGEFVGPTELRAIINTREATFGGYLHDLVQDHQPMFGTPIGGDGRNRVCPACGGEMGVINYGGDTGVSVDRCEDCGGIWLDHEELEKVQLLIEQWQDRAPEQLMRIAEDLERASYEAAQAARSRFAGSRFAFVNALINRLLDAAA